MKTPISARIPGNLRLEGIPAVAARLKAVGLQAIDVPELNDEVASVCKNVGLAIGTVDVLDVPQLLSSDKGRRDRAVASVQKQILDVARLQGKALFVCLVPEDLSQSIEISFEYFQETFPQVVKACEENNVRIALEGWPGPAPNYPTLGYTPEAWRAMFRAIPSSALGLCFDPSHLVRLGIDYMRVLEEFQNRIVHVHGKDTELLSEQQYLYGHLPARIDRVPAFSEGAWRYCIPGDGEVDWRRVAYRLEQIGYEGCISIELEDARFTGSVDAEIRGIEKAFHHLSRHFACQEKQANEYVIKA